jgi:hypothetical protein
MALTLPADFPQAGRSALDAVKKVHTPTYIKILEFIGVTWGDLDGIDKAIRIWQAEATRAKESIERLDKSFTKLTGADAESYWQGNARQEYVSWRNDLKANTLDKYLQNMWNIKEGLDSIHGNIWSIRGHVLALTLEAGGIALGMATAETIVGAAEGVIALVAFVGTWLDYYFRVKGDLDEKGRMLEVMRDRDRVDRGGGVVSLPFKTHVISDWDNWQNKQN